MLEFFRKLFNSDFMPHGHCFLWQPGIVWLHVISDILISLSYFLIPVGLVQLVRKRRDLEFNWMYLMFGIFILSCGLTHAMNVWDIWHATYRLEGLIKAITAAASLVTAVLLFRLIPVALTIPSPAQLRLEIRERVKAEQEVRSLNSELEKRVGERTASLERSNQALQRFAYIASHDLQEPIRTIRSMNQLLARDYKGQIDSKADQYIDFVVEASDRMQSLLVDLMSYAIVLDQASPRNEGRVDTNALVESILSDLRALIEDSGAIVTRSELPAVFADKAQVRQIFLNLLTNAMKYVPKGRAPLVSITGSQSDGICTFKVKDNGIGIDPKYAEQIFVAFRRLHGREYPGSGVGLTICKDIVEGYKGRIWLQSEDGAGSTFYFTLPAPEMEHERANLVADSHSVSL
jgi:signal transduction histidine kinase